MARRELPKPAQLSWPLWKVLLLMLVPWGGVTMFSWLLKFAWEPGRYAGFHSDPPSFPPLTVGDVLLGSGFVIGVLWGRWAWRPRRKHARWHRWLVAMFISVYWTALLWWAGIRAWNVLLPRPWGVGVGGLSTALYLVAWLLPALSEDLSRRIAAAQDALDLRILGCAGAGVGKLMVTAGILGAMLGKELYQHGGIGTLNLVFGVAGPLFSFFGAQYMANQLWPYRPWAKERESREA